MEKVEIVYSQNNAHLMTEEISLKRRWAQVKIVMPDNEFYPIGTTHLDFVIVGDNFFQRLISANAFKRRIDIYKSITRSIGLLVEAGFVFKSDGNIRVEKQGVLFAKISQYPNDIFTLKKAQKVLDKLCKKHCK